jgi:hypothetical protein
MMRRRSGTGQVAAVLALVCACVLGGGRVAGAAHDDDALGAFRGKVVFSDVLIAPAESFPSPQIMAVALRRLEHPVVGGRDGFWRFHFVAFMDPAPDTAALKVAVTDVTQPKHRRVVKVFEMTGKPGDAELRVSDFVLTDAMGFEHGHSYELAVARGGDDDGERVGKADVYARGVVTLR